MKNNKSIIIAHASHVTIKYLFIYSFPWISYLYLRNYSCFIM